MLVKCEKCGYENFPQHRYCGMCAAPLRLPGPGGPAPAPPPAPVPSLAVPQYAASQHKEDVVAPAKAAVPRPVSGPSFLGLGDEPAEDKSASYLLEDETTGHRGRNLILILLIAAVAVAAWHWRQDLRIVADRVLNPQSPAKVGGSESQAPNSPAPAASDSTSGTTPASSANAGPPAEQPGAEAKTQAPAGQTSPPPAPVAAAASGAADSTQPAPADHSQAGQSQPSDQSQTDDAAPAGAPKPDAERPAARGRKPAVTPAQRAAASASRTDDLEAQGEKYLYGNGVPENCARARTNLLAAAEHSSAQAASVLATMYATGHCATRDLPTAYRWFGRSLRQDPKNARIEQDLRVLWNQMTPEERQMAMRSER
jgi:cytoskeletal protein RodZ